ncbi:hypothetical protein FWH58_02175 [Candidatus Saccharibacteria bacterium]|nr:hypothetical protein [Candidatus Saccharibacteria bacterium]
MGISVGDCENCPSADFNSKQCLEEFGCHLGCNADDCGSTACDANTSLDPICKRRYWGDAIDWNNIQLTNYVDENDPTKLIGIGWDIYYKETSIPCIYSGKELLNGYENNDPTVRDALHTQAFETLWYLLHALPYQKQQEAEEQTNEDVSSFYDSIEQIGKLYHQGTRDLQNLDTRIGQCRECDNVECQARYIDEAIDWNSTDCGVLVNDGQDQVIGFQYKIIFKDGEIPCQQAAQWLIPSALDQENDSDVPNDAYWTLMYKTVWGLLQKLIPTEEDFKFFIKKLDEIGKIYGARRKQHDRENQE